MWVFGCFLYIHIHENLLISYLNWSWTLTPQDTHTSKVRLRFLPLLGQSLSVGQAHLCPVLNLSSHLSLLSHKDDRCNHHERIRQRPAKTRIFIFYYTLPLCMKNVFLRICIFASVLMFLNFFCLLNKFPNFSVLHFCVCIKCDYDCFPV